MSSLRRCAAVVGIALATAAVAVAQDVTATARDVFNNNKEAVVTVRLVLSQQMSMPGMGSRTDESRVEVTGTVIDATGLTLVSLSETDPSSTIKAMMGARGRDVQIESRVSEARIIKPDGSEVEAKVVLRDRDLDFAFLRPSTTEANWKFADLTQPSAQLQVLDQIVIIARMGRIANRVYGASVDRIQAMVERPRLFYIPVGVDPSGGLGSPAFGMDGKLLGVNLLRTIQPEASGGAGTRGDDNAVVVVIPAADIQEAAAQAPSYEEAAKQEESEKAAAPQDQAQPPAEGGQPAPGAPAPAPAPGAPAPEPAPGAPAPAPAPGAPAPAPAPAAPSDNVPGEA